MLKEKALQIHSLLEEKKNVLLAEKARLAEKRESYIEDYKEANTGDRSENAPLEEAIRNLKDVNSAISINDAQLRNFEKLEDVDKYNSVGIVLPYSTVRLSSDGEEFIFRIYPPGMSFVDIGAIAGDSRLALAILNKRVGDVVEVEHTSRKVALSYKIEEIY